MNIELRKWSIQDKSDLINLCNQADRSYLSGRLPYPYSEADANWWLDMVMKEEGKTGVFRAIFVDNQLVGNISVERNEGIFDKDAKIGYLLLTEQWSKGIMSESVRQICSIAFQQLDLIRITGEVFSANIASRKVLEKNGFSLEGVMKKAVVKEDKIYDLCIYGLLKEGDK